MQKSFVFSTVHQSSCCLLPYHLCKDSLRRSADPLRVNKKVNKIGSLTPRGLSLGQSGAVNLWCLCKYSVVTPLQRSLPVNFHTRNETCISRPIHNHLTSASPKKRLEHPYWTSSASPQFSKNDFSTLLPYILHLTLILTPLLV